MESKVEASPRRRSRLVPMLLLLAIAASEFIVRSTLRSDGGNDFATPFVSTVRFLHGSDPYSPANFLADWHAAGAPAGSDVILAGRYSIYPPITLVAFGPLALFPWPSALALYQLFSAGLYAGLVYCLALKVGDGWRSPKRLGFAAFALALTSVHAGIHQGNPSVLAFTLCAFALLSAERRRELPAGVLLALGFCLKPTSAPAAILLVLLYGRKRTLLVAALTALVIAGVALIAMARLDPVWKLDYQNNLAFMFGPLGGASFITDSPGRFDLLNLQVPLYAVLRNPREANLAAWGIGGLLAVIWLALFYSRQSRFRQAPARDFDWLAAASLTLIGLLPFYQRNYNIGVVLFALVWAFRALPLRAAKLVLGLCAFFLFPGEALLRRLGTGPRLEHNLAWNVIVMSQTIWAVLAIVLVLLYVQYQYDRPPSSIAKRSS